MKNKVLVVEDDISIGEKNFSETNNIDSISEVKLLTTIKDAKNTLDGNGIQLLRWLKEKQIETKVLIFSINKELKRLCLQSGAHDFFDKSKDFDALLDTISDC